MDEAIFSIPIEQLPYDPSDEQDILQHAKRMAGLTLGELAGEVGRGSSGGSANKGDFGGVVEAWFHLKPNARQEADFPETVWGAGAGVGIEIKTLPIKRLKTAGFRSKERTVLTMIDFEALAKETWDTASVKNKMRRILFVTYLHDYDDKSASTVQDAFLWSPPRTDFPQFEKDWRALQDAVVRGDPGQISEGLGRYLGACTKGSRDPRHRRLPNGKEAHPRAWALKASYTWTHVQAVLDPGSFVQSAAVLSRHDPTLTLDDFEIVERTGLTRLEHVERTVLDILHGLKDKTIESVCKEYKIPTHGRDKNLAARLLSKILGIQEGQEILELAAAGIRVKTMHFRDPALGPGPRTPAMHAFESMSFPQVDLIRMAAEDWDKDEIEFREQIQRLLIIPTYSHEGRSPQGQRRIGRAFLWSPTPDQMRLVREDWHLMQSILREGGVVYTQKVDSKGNLMWRRNKDRELVPDRENDMPGNEPGRAAHMRPKARDSRDETMEPTGNMVTKQCLWLNGCFIRDLLIPSLGPNPSAAGVTV